MCTTRAVFCRNRGCRRIVGELILKPCEEATNPTDSSTRITTQIYDTSSSSACGSEGGETNGEEEWLADARPYLFGCGQKEYTERHRCGYRVCSNCFQKQMMTYILGLAMNGIESEDGEPSLLARRQHLSLYGDLGEECQTPREVCAQDPAWSPGYPAMLNDGMVKVEDPGLLVNSAPVAYRATPGMMDDIYDGPFIDGGQIQPGPAQLQQQVLHPGQAEPYLYQDPGPSFQPTGLEDPDPQLLDWRQSEPQLLDFLMQPAAAPVEAAPAGDPSSCVEDVRDTASADILSWEANIEAQAGGHGPAFTHSLEEAVCGGDVGSHMWNQDVVWGASGYYS
ncbi:unnamed protein product [Clonostachys rosea f. rosea IK726]|uniref:Uncharacterized protein n=1 Tax=Clonostachys rosea f. rosea IK726 TaxID=1349383 RepID=A0ACA9TBE2_BIOOC|nr:unnamed protein product [Clonostachys rosea f. rosea IK726]